MKHRKKQAEGYLMNSVIEELFTNFTVDGKSIPVSFLRYTGNKTTYITYMLTNTENSLSAEDQIQNYVDYYDFDVYSKGNYMKIIEEVINKMTGAGFIWQPSQSSGDMYEDDTGYFHRTVCFAIERSVNING